MLKILCSLCIKGTLLYIHPRIYNTFSHCLVLVHYIGPGKKDTGDWCFADDFITFKDLADAYIDLEFSEPKCLEITSDCSYSGKWVSKCREFLNGAGVQPCGHSAMKENILLKVKTSHEIQGFPQQK